MKHKPQKFVHGDRVHICKKLDSTMAHFASDCDAIIIGSYADLYAPYNENCLHTYCLFLLPHKEDPGYQCSWYPEHCLQKRKGPSGARFLHRLRLKCEYLAVIAENDE